MARCSARTIHFNPRAPCGARRPGAEVFYIDLADFNPRAPCGARLVQMLPPQLQPQFQSTRPVWGATMFSSKTAVSQPISIHAPRVGRDHIYTTKMDGREIFQSTRPVWGATDLLAQEYDTKNGFQSTRPVWGATIFVLLSFLAKKISIHAPRVGRDSEFRMDFVYFLNFNPRAPCGARRRKISRSERHCIFQSTRPVWGATEFQAFENYQPKHFNPRAPCGARRERLLKRCVVRCYFNPRAPCGARPGYVTNTFDGLKFQSTRPVWGATRMTEISRFDQDYFNPRAPCGARPRFYFHGISDG